MINVSIKALAMAATLAVAAPSQAATVNLVADSGWSRFAFGDVGTTASRKFSFTLTKNAILSVVDGFFAGDVLEVFANAVSLGQTTAPMSGATNHGMNFDAAFADTNFSSGQFLLGAGTYSISLNVLERSAGSGNHLGAIRLDLAAVPLPAGGALLLSGLGLAALMRRRRRAAE